MKTTFIYFLQDPENPNKGYLGKSDNPKKRLGEHITENRASYRSNWIRSLARRGKRPVLEIIDEVPFEYWEQLEVAYIEFFREQGYILVNSHAGGTGGHNPTPETRAKMRAARLGKKLTPEQCAAISARQLGKKMSPESCLKIGISKSGEKHPNFGKKLKPETCAKISDAQKGEKNHFFGKKLTSETCAKISAAHLGKKKIINTSGFAGVSRHANGKWRSRFRFRGIAIHVGLFHKIEDAVFALALVKALQ